MSRRRKPFLTHPRCHTIYAYPNTVKFPPSCPPISLTRGSPETRRPPPQVRAASKSPSSHVAHVVHGPQLVEPQSGLYPRWEMLLQYIALIKQSFRTFLCVLFVLDLPLPIPLLLLLP